jgi:hypothetical protein
MQLESFYSTEMMPGVLVTLFTEVVWCGSAVCGYHILTEYSYLIEAREDKAYFYKRRREQEMRAWVELWLP